MTTKNEIIQEVKEWCLKYNISSAEIILIGSAALVMQGVITDHTCNDIDILTSDIELENLRYWFREEIIPNNLSEGKEFVHDLSSLSFENSRVELRVNHTFPSPSKNSSWNGTNVIKFNLINGLIVATPEALLELYTGYNREKDAAKIKALELFIRNKTDTFTQNPGYHITNIPRGEFGSSSKLEEEVNEIKDAEVQGNKIMMLVELSDLYGAMEGFLNKNFPDFTMADLATMSKTTKRAFTNGTRSPRD